MDLKKAKTFYTHSSFRLIALNLFFAGIYFLFARLGLILATLNHSVSPVWPATGFAFSVIFLYGRSFWPAVAIGAFAANYLTGGPLLATLLITIGNTLEAIAGAFILQKVYSYRKSLEYQTDLFAFALASVFASFISAAIGTTSLFLANVVPKEMLSAVFLTWWIGDALGGLVVSPLLCNFKLSALKEERVSNLFGTSLLALGIFYFVFALPTGSQFLFLLFPILLIAACLLSKSLVFLFSIFIYVVCIFATLKGYGPFASGTTNEKLIHLQLFLASIGITALMLAALGKNKLTKIPVLVLLLSWAVTGAIFHSFERSEQEKSDQHFSALIEKTQENLKSREEIYEEALRSGIGLFTASKNIQYEDWRSYIAALKIFELHPGVQGIGIIWSVAKNQIPNFEKEIRNQGLNNFKVKYLSEDGAQYLSNDQLRYVIKYLEPLESNLQASGLDIGSEPVRRSAAELARDTGKVVATAKLTLVQDKEKTPGFLLLLPIYKKNTVNVSLEDRRKNHIGWVYSPVICKNFFSAILSKTTNELELRVFDGDEGPSDTRLFDNFSTASSELGIKAISHFEIGQRNLTLKWRKSPQYISPHNTIVAWVGLCGALASLLLTNLLISIRLVSQRSRAMAEELTQELSFSREKFKEGERRLLYALDGSADGVWDWNIEKSEMYVSDQICKNFGWPQISKIRGLEDLKKVAHPDDIDKVANSLKRHLQGAAPCHEVETRYRNVSGEWVWVLTRGKISERDDAGLPKRVTGVHIDISALKAFQMKLESTQYMLGAIANAVPSLISHWDNDFKCKFANDSFSKWWGIDLEKLSKMSLQEVLPPQIFEKRKALFEKAMAGESIDYESDLIRRCDNEVRYVKLSLRPNRMNGVSDGFFIFGLDITELKKAELSANEERLAALEATKIKSQFLANMSHEIRTPINGIIGMTNLLKTTELTKKQFEYADLVSRSSDSLLNVINDILDFSKVEAGKLDLEIIEFDLSELVEGTKKALLYHAQEKSVALILNYELDSSFLFKGDPGRIRQILTNLISNAVKFTSKGEVAIKVRALKENDSGSLLRFEVVDSGIGIPKEILGRMFQAFSQADASTSRRFGGTGLGLSISKHLVNLMSGQIGVDSAIGKGSTFWFEINLERGSQIVKREVSNGFIQPTQGARILVAEDNRINQQIALETLRKFGYQAHAVGNGNEVLDALREAKYELILMDCLMPEMDGYEATKIIRKSQTLGANEIPIIALSASNLKEDSDKCLAVGMNDFLSKPVKEDLLLNAIENQLKKNINLKTSITNEVPQVRGRILVVEDNKVNQKVICINLEKQFYDFDIAENGLEALQKLNETDYDIILMDCQMPELDGYEATKRIRLLDNEKLSKIPIIALTANAIKGDRERCLEAGMNDYLSKPVNFDNLFKSIEKWMALVKSANESIFKLELPLNAPAAVSEESIRNLQVLQRPGEPSFVAGLIDLFLESAHESLKKIKLGLNIKNFKEVSNLAHSLKSSSANLGALRLADLCFAFESLDASTRTNPNTLEAKFSELEAEYSQVVKELDKYRSAA